MLGAHADDAGRRRRRALRRVGAERRAGQRGRRLQRLGRPRAPDARRAASSGVWELFVPGLAAGALYKFEIRNRDSGPRVREDRPVRARFELRPGTAVAS